MKNIIFNAGSIEEILTEREGVEVIASLQKKFNTENVDFWQCEPGFGEGIFLITPEQEDLKSKIKALRKQKLTFREIGERLGITKQRASQLFQAAGGKQAWNKWEKFAEAWKKEVEAGATIQAVAEKYKASTGVVFRQLKKIGVQATGKPGSKPKIFSFEFCCEKCGKSTLGVANVKKAVVFWNCPECDSEFEVKKEKFFESFKQT